MVNFYVVGITSRTDITTLTTDITSLRIGSSNRTTSILTRFDCDLPMENTSATKVALRSPQCITTLHTGTLPGTWSSWATALSLEVTEAISWAVTIMDMTYIAVTQAPTGVKGLKYVMFKLY